jgi:DNA polymerase V
MQDDGQGGDNGSYSGGETTGFQSPAQDHIEHVIDLARVLDLQKPGIYPVRVSGQAFAERGIKDGDILIANTAARPAHGKVAVAVLQGSFRLATLERRGGSWFLRPSGTKEALPVSDDAEIWAIVAGLVREAV